MARHKHTNRPGFRFCNKCRVESPLTSEHFHRDKNRKCGFSYQCKPCSSEKPDRRRNRHLSATESQKQRKRDWQRRYQADRAPVHRRIASYRATDKSKSLQCDLDVDWYDTNITGKPCVYCLDASTGCDRIDNSLGHTKENVVPCCRECNTARMDQFSHDEMFIVGAAIRTIKIKRHDNDSMAAR